MLNYIEKIYGFSFKRTFSREEAEELTQEIAYQVLKSLPNLKDEEKFEPFLWSIANNTLKVFRRKCGHERIFYSYDNFLSEPTNEDKYDFESEGIYEYVVKQIAYLSGIYRNILVMYYYDNLTCKQIAKELGIPEGTVTWRLSEGRNKIKKECSEMNDTALKPTKITIRINGNGNYNGVDRPFPWAFVDNALSQNIIWLSYKSPISVVELAQQTGVPAFYIEDTITNLINREALIKVGKDKYQTNMVIFSDETHQYMLRFGTNVAKDIGNDFISRLKLFTAEVVKTGIYTAGKCENDLSYVFALLALRELSKKYNPLSETPYPIRYDGNQWSYHAHKEPSLIPNRGISTEININLGCEGALSHYSFHFFEFANRPMMTDVKINICEKILYNQVPDENSKEILAELIRDGYVSKVNDRLTVAISYISLKQKNQFDLLAEKYFSDIMEKYSTAIMDYVNGYEKLFPPHLKDDIRRNSYFLFVTLFNFIAEYGADNGLIGLPSKGDICDVLIQWKER